MAELNRPPPLNKLQKFHGDWARHVRIHKIRHTSGCLPFSATESLARFARSALIMNCFNVYKTLICNSKKIVTYYGWDVGTKKEAFKKHIQTAQQQPCSSAPSSLRPSHGNCIRKGIPSLRSHNVKPFPLPPFFSAL